MDRTVPASDGSGKKRASLHDGLPMALVSSTSQESLEVESPS